MGGNRRGPCLAFSASSLLRRVSELEERCRTPCVDNPVWSFEVLLTAQSTEGFEVLRLQEEGVGELIAVDEKG